MKKFTSKDKWISRIKTINTGTLQESADEIGHSTLYKPESGFHRKNNIFVKKSFNLTLWRKKKRIIN